LGHEKFGDEEQHKQRLRESQEVGLKKKKKSKKNTSEIVFYLAQ
jgi:hypothetical protein